MRSNLIQTLFMVAVAISLASIDSGVHAQVPETTPPPSTTPPFVETIMKGLPLPASLRGSGNPTSTEEAKTGDTRTNLFGSISRIVENASKGNLVGMGHSIDKTVSDAKADKAHDQSMKSKQQGTTPRRSINDEARYKRDIASSSGMQKRTKRDHIKTDE